MWWHRGSSGTEVELVKAHGSRSSGRKCGNNTRVEEGRTLGEHKHQSSEGDSSDQLLEAGVN